VGNPRRVGSPSGGISKPGRFVWLAVSRRPRAREAKAGGEAESVRGLSGLSVLSATPEGKPIFSRAIPWGVGSSVSSLAKRPSTRGDSRGSSAYREEGENPRGGERPRRASATRGGTNSRRAARSLEGSKTLKSRRSGGYLAKVSFGRAGRNSQARRWIGSVSFVRLFCFWRKAERGNLCTTSGTIPEARTDVLDPALSGGAVIARKIGPREAEPGQKPRVSWDFQEMAERQERKRARKGTSSSRGKSPGGWTPRGLLAWNKARRLREEESAKRLRKPESGT